MVTFASHFYIYTSSYQYNNSPLIITYSFSKTTLFVIPECLPCSYVKRESWMTEEEEKETTACNRIRAITSVHPLVSDPFIIVPLLSFP